MEKRYYWLKLQAGFFGSLRIKKLRRMKRGDTLLCIYLKMQLASLAKDGVLEYKGIEDDMAAELAFDLDEKVADVRTLLTFLMENGLLEKEDDNHYILPWVIENTGSESASTQRVRDFRSKQKAVMKDMEEAEEECKQKQHIPIILNHMNKVRYGGNYYVVCRRDGFKCAMCGSIEQLCVHHIDGYDEHKPENNQANKMVVLCRSCHSKVHGNTLIPKELLESIGYFDDVSCNADETRMKRIGNVEKEREKEIDKSRYTRTRARGKYNKALDYEQTPINENDFKALVVDLNKEEHDEIH